MRDKPKDIAPVRVVEGEVLPPIGDAIDRHNEQAQYLRDEHEKRLNSPEGLRVRRKLEGDKRRLEKQLAHVKRFNEDNDDRVEQLEAQVRDIEYELWLLDHPEHLDERMVMKWKEKGAIGGATTIDGTAIEVVPQIEHKS